MSEKKPIGKPFASTHVEALTLADYKRLEKEGKINRPLTDSVVYAKTKFTASNN